MVSSDNLLGLPQNTFLGSPESSRNSSQNDSFRADIEDVEEETKEKRKSKSSTKTINAIQTDLEALSFTNSSVPNTSGANKEAYLRLGSKEMIYSEVKDVIKEEEDEMIEEEMSRVGVRASRTSKAGNGHNFDKIMKPAPTGAKFKSDKNQQSVKFQKSKALTMDVNTPGKVSVGEVNHQLTK